MPDVLTIAALRNTPLRIVTLIGVGARDESAPLAQRRHLIDLRLQNEWRRRVQPRRACAELEAGVRAVRHQKAAGNPPERTPGSCPGPRYAPTRQEMVRRAAVALVARAASRALSVAARPGRGIVFQVCGPSLGALAGSQATAHAPATTAEGFCASSTSPAPGPQELPGFPGLLRTQTHRREYPHPGRARPGPATTHRPLGQVWRQHSLRPGSRDGTSGRGQPPRHSRQSSGAGPEAPPGLDGLEELFVPRPTVRRTKSGMPTSVDNII